eukprot:10296746-Heterocapsa_arctica.AAC.1
MAGAVATSFPGKLFSHLAAAEACQCVSCNDTVLPFRTRFMMACFLSAACEVEWLSSQRGFHDVSTVEDWTLGPR